MVYRRYTRVSVETTALLQAVPLRNLQSGQHLLIAMPATRGFFGSRDAAGIHFRRDGRIGRTEKRATSARA
ncbi:MAG: hypothetical protein BJ554DRAFT_2710 [Olpidium bornovanus]|uniref:Uncharacterized protein n=1 Tax=Olpidium bornovanus TaxID=278681 RepID=A0A8H7ZQ33_9FUNG|nr:MAG: hypothetical protein BJ554DRAFT_2710 [Olpidium bornovanus]